MTTIHTLTVRIGDQSKKFAGRTQKSAMNALARHLREYADSHLHAAYFNIGSIQTVQILCRAFHPQPFEDADNGNDRPLWAVERRYDGKPESFVTFPNRTLAEEGLAAAAIMPGLHWRETKIGPRVKPPTTPPHVAGEFLRGDLAFWIKSGKLAVGTVVATDAYSHLVCVKIGRRTYQLQVGGSVRRTPVDFPPA